MIGQTWVENFASDSFVASFHRLCKRVNTLARIVWFLLCANMLVACHSPANNVEADEGAFYLRLGGDLYRVPFEFKPLVTEYPSDALESELAKGRGTQADPIDSELFSFRPYPRTDSQRRVPVARILASRNWSNKTKDADWPSPGASIESFELEFISAGFNDPGSDFREYSFSATTKFDDGIVQQSPFKCRGHDRYGEGPQWEALSGCGINIRLSESARLSLRIQPGHDFEKIERDFRASFAAARCMKLEQ